jgi:hypothetical protein
VARDASGEITAFAASIGPTIFSQGAHFPAWLLP